VNTLDASGLPYNSTGYRWTSNELGWLVANGAVVQSQPDYGLLLRHGGGKVLAFTMCELRQLGCHLPEPAVQHRRGYSASKANGNDVIYGPRAGHAGLELPTPGALRRPTLEMTVH